VPGAEERPDRLPPPTDVTALQSWTGGLLCRPWFDALALHAVARWYLPLSRGWATAAANGTLPALTRLADGYTEAETRWRTDFFGPADPGPRALVASELARVDAARAFMAFRSRLLWSLPSLPAANWAIVSPQDALDIHGESLADEARRFPPPAKTEILESRRLAGALGTEYWLRFPTTVASQLDTAWAHVYEPAEVPARATFIFLHGIAMETELWGPVSDPVNELTAQGIRVVRPEGPWHGRRRWPGWYGGEPILARGVAGFVALFEAWLRELALLVAWARDKDGARVAVGGVSLGALACQLSACAARRWPKEMQPDAQFLLATSGDLMTVARRGALARALGIPARLEAAGWDDFKIAGWRPLLEPAGQPVMGGSHTVMVLGRADNVTPFPGGLALARQWRVPDTNLFLRRQGHFTVALGLWRDAAPLRRLIELLLD
jgi:hypothetical protein